MNIKHSPILVGDIGGTHARFALANFEGPNIRLAHFKKYKGDNFANLEDVIDVFLKDLTETPKAAALAIAGPVHDGQVSLTNRDWNISTAGLGNRFGFQHARLFNDFSAMARSVPLIGSNGFKSVYTSQYHDPASPVLVAGPGTGFGMATLIPSHPVPLIISGEGGHQAYAPQSKEETELLHILQAQTDFVSLELVSSGAGMHKVHAAICERHGTPYSKLPPHIIREKADAGDPVCLEVCETRAAAVMGAVGDMALACGALGGVVLAGGVSERLMDFMRHPKAMARFFNRGARSDYMARIPIRLLTQPDAALYGAAALFSDHTFNQAD